MGGLGNQLFQYAAGLLQAVTTQKALILLKPVDNIHDTSDYRRNLFTLGEPYDDAMPPHITLYQDDGFASWNPLDYTAPIILLYGYFQNYTCLKSILEEFRNHITNTLTQQRNAMREKYKLKNGCGFIHVRRGDYVQTNFILKDTSYYTEAIQHFKDIQKWYILSDDIQWCKESQLFNHINVEYVDETSPVDCLALMCEIHDAAIIANSTFSWMGAFFGCGTTNVVYPKDWIYNGTPDLFPNGWVSL
jgi:hypothetical protein